jgi:adenine specific DNA methylase Mod
MFRRLKLWWYRYKLSEIIREQGNANELWYDATCRPPKVIKYSSYIIEIKPNENKRNR